MLGFRIRHALSRRLWVIPLLGILAGAGLSVVTVAIDRRLHSLVTQPLVGSPSDASTILSTIAASVVTLTSIVLTITLVAVQLAMGQFSPRIVRALLDDRGSQVSVALFGATFTFAIFSLRAIGTGPGADSTPGVTVMTAFVLVAASSVTLVVFVHHAAQQLRVGGLIDLVGDELRAQLDDGQPPPAERHAGDGSVVTSAAAGNLIHVDEGGLVELARRADCTLELVPMMGDFLMRGSPLVRIHGDASRLDARAIRSRVALDNERTHNDDPSYGFRKLVDVAQRALGASSNDATSAVQVVNRLHDCLRQLADRPLPSGVHRDRTGVVRLTMRTLTWDGYVRLAFDEIRLAGVAYPQVTRRMCAAIEDLKSVAPGDRQAPLDRQLRLLTAGVHRALDDEDDVRAALVPDAQGLGSGADVADGQSAVDAPSAVAARRIG